MATCKVCGNTRQHSFDIVVGDERATYDCFECAIHDAAPTCAHCHCRVLGHGIELGVEIYCCVHCVEAHGAGVTPPASSAGAAAAEELAAADPDNVVEDLAAARRRLHPEAAVRWEAPYFPLTRGVE